MTDKGRIPAKVVLSFPASHESWGSGGIGGGVKRLSGIKICDGWQIGILM